MKLDKESYEYQINLETMDLLNKLVKTGIHVPYMVTYPSHDGFNDSPYMILEKINQSIQSYNEPVMRYYLLRESDLIKFFEGL